ncbi:GGDEF domain-containing protein [Thiocapsa sp. UBA6158]|jgi:diguanylate cyclase (GGDEF)-like protein|uniref:GGDEF domain-containing protein n=1 Tax=Thiocapsa sp. UBA6158 TaxID=1947692 RepID=UPI0025CDE2A9|nr:sensor domain-containing diguanylate cyclase [Thiocapsa sp. UBA6158]
MNDRALPTRRRFSLTLERNLAVIFALLGILLTTLIALHWVLVIEPTLRADAESRSRAFAQAQTSGIETLLRNEGRPDELANAIRTELDAVLLLKDESTGTPFVRRITLVLDEDLVTLPTASLELARGVEQCMDCFVTQVPLYDPDGHLLVGIATFYSSPQFLNDLVRSVRGKLLWVGGAMLLVIGFAWFGASRVLRRLAESESNLRTLFEAAPFPMILAEHGPGGVTQANQAAKTYLALEPDSTGRLNSAAWEALAADGLPAGIGEQRETQILTRDLSRRWAVVSAIPIRFSGVSSRIVSLADISELKATQQELRMASLTDGLTGAYNRRYLLQKLAEEIERARRYGDALSVILLDLDAFKTINDTFGHRVGDEVLVKVASTLRTCVRDVDVSGRYGGEEFLVILPHACATVAIEVAERIRSAVKALTWSQNGLRVTVSSGVCEYAGQDVDGLVEIADQRLYRAKEGGRDRVVGAS